jgi:hypothetical protein
MRLCFSVVSLVLSCMAVGALAQAGPSALIPCSDLKLVPAPRECKDGASYSLNLGVSLVADGNVADNFAASDLKLALDAHGIPASIKGGLTVWLMHSDDALAAKLLLANQLKFDSSLHDEGYILVPDGQGGLAVIAQTSTGIFYGTQTVKQLIRGAGKDAVLLEPTLRDWPAMAHRGLSDDWSRGPLPNADFLKREIRTLATYKINTFSPYFEHTFAYASTPLAAFPGGAITPAEGRELVAYAAQYHITIIPEQESFGHLHHLLKFEQYAGLGETPHGTVLAPGEAATQPIIAGWFRELAEVFPGPYAHIGADETDDLGLGKTHERVKQQGLGAVYLDFLKQIHTTLAPNHKQLIFWGDIAVNSPELVGTLPKDMIAIPWAYDARADFKPIIEPFTKVGLETWVAPGVSNWNRMYPNNNEAMGNIRAFARDAQALGSTGILNTVWNDDGEGIFDQNWFGVLFGAAAGWQKGESSEEKFVASFGQAFHGDSTGKISQAQRELMDTHKIFANADLEDGFDSYFWLDPYSREGQRVAGKLRPSLSELRLHAERAITLVAEARAAGSLSNSEALDALELGARRIDFVGLKFQLAEECAAAYAQSQALAADKAHHDEVLASLYNNSQRFHDLHDGYMLLRGLYQQVWLRDNRPYWLDNNLNRYDRAELLWADRTERWSQVFHQWRDSETLPSAAEIGLPAPVGK